MLLAVAGCASAALLSASARLSAPQSVERWAVWEANLTHPTAAIHNPFLDVQLQATFKLLSAQDEAAAPPAPALPLVALDFAAGTEVVVPNHGTSQAKALQS